MPKSLVAQSPRSSPNSLARPTALPLQAAGGACIPEHMISRLSRRRLLTATAAGFCTLALAEPARSQTAVPSPKRVKTDEYFVTEPASIEVNAQLLAGFDTRDRS